LGVWHNRLPRVRQPTPYLYYVSVVIRDACAITVSRMVFDVEHRPPCREGDVVDAQQAFNLVTGARGRYLQTQTMHGLQDGSTTLH
jgi:hypothetical protein